MSTTTTNYSLVKPATSDLIDITVLNSDLDAVDTALKAISDANGFKVLSGASAPTSQGVDGDWYINTTNHYLYGPKATTWPTGTSLVGPQGAAGSNGTNGTNGAAGTNGTNGAGVATGGTTGQILNKTSNSDYATGWTDPVSTAGLAPIVEVVNTVASAGTAQTLSDPATKSINDLTLDNASPCVLTFPSSTAGSSFTLVLRQSGSTRTVTWPGGIKWAGGVVPTLSTVTGSIDIFSFTYVTAWNGFVGGLAMA